MQEALRLAYPEQPLDRASFDLLLGQISVTRQPEVLRARLFAAARRAPRELLSRLWTVTPASEIEVVARGLAGRRRTEGPTELPPALEAPLREPHPPISIATVVARFRVPVPNLTPAAFNNAMISSVLEDQVAGARLLSSPSAALPTVELLDTLTPATIPPLARSLSTREATSTEVWIGLIRLVSNRARLAPRLWGNAWLAVRDAAPANRMELRSELLAGAGRASTATSLPSQTLAHWRCDNAAFGDKLTGWPASTLDCATGTEAWIALAAQASVLGSSQTEPGRRAQELSSIAQRARGEARVLEAVATASTALPPSATGGLVRRLATEHDPGVLAALLEGLVLHVQHTRSLPPAVLQSLLRAPFELPEPVSLEARIHALELARMLNVPAITTLASDSGVAAVQAARLPDGGALPTLPPPAPSRPTVRLRFTTDAGAFEIELRSDAAPLAVEQVVSAARNRRYDGLTFHRVVPGFVAQGGDPRGDGYGGTDAITPTELSMRRFERSSVGIPLGGLDTGGIQLFITLADAPHLDGRYPWVGRVIQGMDAVDGLMAGDRILHAEVISFP